MPAQVRNQYMYSNISQLVQLQMLPVMLGIILLLAGVLMQEGQRTI
jgi:hypothetical protein